MDMGEIQVGTKELAIDALVSPIDALVSRGIGPELDRGCSLMNGLS